MFSFFGIVFNFFHFFKYWVWIIFILIILFIVFFIYRKFTGQNFLDSKNSIYILFFTLFIIVVLFFLLKKESITKNYDKLIIEVDKIIEEYDNLLNKYKGLSSSWQKEFDDVESKLTQLLESQNIGGLEKEKIKNTMEKNETDILKIKAQLSDVQGEISIEKGKLIDLEKEKIKIENEIKEKNKELEKEINAQKRNKLFSEIEELQKKQMKIVEEITNTKIKIQKLEKTEESLIKQLKIAEEFKQHLIQSMDSLNIELKKIASQIVSVEERKKEIKKEIDELNAKIELIKTEKEAYQVLKYHLLLLRQNAENWERENSFSWGSLVKTVFKVFDTISDFLPIKTGFRLNQNQLEFDRYSEKQNINNNEYSTLSLPKEHRISRIIDSLTQKPGEGPKTISVELLKMYMEEINRDIKQLENDYVNYEQTFNNYKEKFTDNSILNEVRDLKVKMTKENDKTIGVYSEWIGSYEQTIEELEKKRTEVIEKDNHINTMENLQKQKNKVEENIQDKEIEYVELQKQNPNYDKIQQMITNKKNEKTQIKVPQFQRV
ncbi:DNA double-strand break repair Rad50 ATPase [Candidatus Phytoplasma luffae]|uniref:DNA double-strand break repair Rad50 ATPase n=1 Tax=Loofah witches'-broom phytoplasma TaxID=35773 RepID=A0A975FLJ0_LOWBP|nr:hypothetical protein [Candidatus Phytoplasma luffae]QTX03196.1 DNA double-strand break repair Rad50 ATPase [Candidatus Phytoplasma luffae]